VDNKYIFSLNSISKMSTRKVSNLTKKKVAACQEWKCKLCNCLLDECFEIDHIICIKDGGNNEECNLQALCPNCHRKKTNNDIYKPKKETKETKETKEKVHLPQWWKEYLEHPERQGRFVCDMVRSSYPQLVWNKDITNLNKYTVDELKIMLASINGQVKNGTKKEIVSFINDESIKRNNLMEQFINPVVTILPPTDIIHSKQKTTTEKISKLITSTVNTTTMNPMMDPMMMNPMRRAMYN
jgi:hypothetical protein